MFDFIFHTEDTAMTAPPVLFLSSPFGAKREWTGVSEFLGPRGACRAFDRADEWTRRIEVAPDGVHLVAHGTAAYHALMSAMEAPHAVRSVTLVDPDIICAMPDLADCPQFRRHLRMIRHALDLSSGRRSGAAAARVIDYWMGRKAWARSAPAVRDRFAGAMPELAEAWRGQRQAPLNPLQLVALRCPVRVVTGRRAPAEVRSLARLLRMVVPELSISLVNSARGASHLTDPHIVAPDIGKFIVSSDMRWQTDTRRAVAA